MPRNNLTYVSPNGVIVVPYRGNITDVEADGAVTREDKFFRKESLVTKSLVSNYPALGEQRVRRNKKTKIVFWDFPYKEWTVEVSRLPSDCEPVRYVFHAIMQLPREAGPSGDWQGNMETMYRTLLKDAERLNVSALALPLLGSGQGNVKVAARIAIQVISEHQRKKLQKIFILSKGKNVISEVISCCVAADMSLIHGNQPEGGRMVATRDLTHLPGYEHCGTITVMYTFSDGVQGEEHPNPGVAYRGTTRQAYLPDCPEGLEVLGLLATAFEDKKLTFTVGRSRTTGKNNVIKYNGIPHKTSKERGKKHGYPDPQYLKTVRTCLKQRGVTDLKRVRIENVSPHKYSPENIDELERVTRNRKYSVRENDAKGNCMFFSLSQQMKHVLHKDIGHGELRAQLVQFLRENPKGPDKTSYAEFLTDETWEDYLGRMSREGQWGDHLILTAAAGLFRVNVAVFKEGSKTVLIKTHASCCGTFFVRLSKERHYVSIEFD